MVVVCDAVAGNEDFRAQGSNALRRVGQRIHQNQFSVAAVIPDRCNAIAGEQGVAVAENLLRHSRHELPLDSRNNTTLQTCERRR